MATSIKLYLGLGSLILLFAMLALPTLLILFFGMLPTLVAFIVDRTTRKSQAICVGSMNFAGVFPSLMELWYETANTYSEAVEIFSSVFAIGIMYSAASFGYLIYMLIPPIVTTFLNVMAQRRITLLKDAQKEIIEEWGSEVAQIVAEEAAAAAEAEAEVESPVTASDKPVDKENDFVVGNLELAEPETKNLTTEFFEGFSDRLKGAEEQNEPIEKQASAASDTAKP